MQVVSSFSHSIEGRLLVILVVHGQRVLREPKKTIDIVDPVHREQIVNLYPRRLV